MRHTTPPLAQCRAEFLRLADIPVGIGCSLVGLALYRLREKSAETGEVAVGNPGDKAQTTKEKRVSIVDIDNAAHNAVAIAWRELKTTHSQAKRGLILKTPPKTPVDNWQVTGIIRFALGKGILRVIDGRKVSQDTASGRNCTADDILNEKRAGRRFALDSEQCDRIIEREAYRRYKTQDAVQADIYEAIAAMPSKRCRDAAHYMLAGYSQQAIADNMSIGKGTANSLCKATRRCLASLVAVY